MLQETKEKLERVQERIKKNGEKIMSAIKAENLSADTYYKWKRGLEKEPGSKLKTKKAKTAKPERAFVEVPLKTQQANVAIVVCQPDQIKSILDGLQ